MFRASGKALKRAALLQQALTFPLSGLSAGPVHALCSQRGGRIDEARTVSFRQNKRDLGAGKQQSLRPLIKQFLCRLQEQVMRALDLAGLHGSDPGHVPDWTCEAISQLTQSMPVVLCSRTGAGRVHTNTYGYPGGEIDLIRRGVIPGENLSAPKARLLLSLCLLDPPKTAADNFSKRVASLFNDFENTTLFGGSGRHVGI